MAETQVEKPVTTGKKKAAGAQTGNMFFDVATRVENLTKSKALTEADRLAESIETNYFELGGVLSVIHKNAWFVFQGYESFDIYVYERFGFQSRKARYLIDIYTELVNKQIPYEKVAALGWTKLKDLAKLLTLDNVDEWVEKAKGLTVIELQALLKAGPTKEKVETTDEFTTVKFKLKQDQVEVVNSALNKAKAEGQTEFDNVALEYICAGYLGGSITTTAAPLPDQMQKAGIVDTCEALGKAFPEYNFSVVEAGSNPDELGTLMQSAGIEAVAEKLGAIFPEFSFDIKPIE